jgi:hypothetical protein
MSSTLPTIPWFETYIDFLRNSTWFPSSRSAGNEWISGPLVHGVFHDRFGSGWGYYTKCPVVPGPTGYRFSTNFYPTIEEARAALIKEIIASAPIMLKAMAAMTPSNDNIPPTPLDLELKAWLNRS